MDMKPNVPDVKVARRNVHATIITMLKDVEENVLMRDEKIKNPSRDTGTMKKNQVKISYEHTLQSPYTEF